MTETFVLWPERPEIKHNLIRRLNALDPGKVWDVEIKEYRKPKTVSQRAWWHKLLTLYGMELGYTLPEMKDVVKREYFGTKECKVGGKVRELPDGHSEELGKMPYSELIELTYRLAAHDGVVLPEADRFRRTG